MFSVVKYGSALCALSMLSSCYAYRVFPKEDRLTVPAAIKQKVYVVNPQLKKEYRILKSSNMFEESSDSADPRVLSIRLYPLGKEFACGQPALGSLITLGQVPVYLPDVYHYRFDEIHGTDTIARRIDLHVAERLWFWDMFTFQKNFPRKAGQALAAGYYKTAKASGEGESTTKN